MKSLFALATTLLATLSIAQDRESRWELELETGLSSTRYNDARVPKSTGTNIDLAGIVGRAWKPFGRVSIMYRDKKDATWKLLYAPFRQTGSGTLDQPTSFAGRNFSAGPVEATYQFNSYRLTYRKPWKNGWGIGGTLKVRDAEIRLTQAGTATSESNVGFVPLLNLFKSGELSPGLGYEFEFDGLAGGPGRAFDVSLRVKKELSRDATAFLGFRVLEGGADIERVRNFALVTYLTAGVSIRF